MADDIVTRMRSVDFNCDYCQTWEACLEAADEIERWRHIAKELYTWLQPSPEDDGVYEAGVEAMTMYCEAMNNE